MAELDRPAVFDAFAGSGRMHQRVYRTAAHYVGCDLVWYRDMARMAFVADNRRVLRAIDLHEFNLFDFDAYGSPWEQCLILANRRKVRSGEKVGLVLTDGSALNMKLSGMPLALRAIARFESVPAGANQLRDDVFDRALVGLADRMMCRIIRRWQADGHSGAQVRYTGLVLVGA